jgi:hypothetical protein
MNSNVAMYISIASAAISVIAAVYAGREARLAHDARCWGAKDVNPYVSKLV